MNYTPSKRGESAPTPLENLHTQILSAYHLHRWNSRLKLAELTMRVMLISGEPQYFLLEQVYHEIAYTLDDLPDLEPLAISVYEMLCEQTSIPVAYIPENATLTFTPAALDFFGLDDTEEYVVPEDFFGESGAVSS